LDFITYLNYHAIRINNNNIPHCFYSSEGDYLPKRNKMKALENLPPFYVGQTIIGKTPNNIGYPERGKKYKVQAIKKARCCGKWLVYTGVKSGYPLINCRDCGAKYKNDHFYSAHRFESEKEQSFPIMTFEKIVEKEKEEILINN
jgi:hypothetical protein